MAARREIACGAADALASWNAGGFPAILGFDGFVDDILRVVGTRHSHERFDAMDSIESFGKKIVAAGGQSANFELVLQRRKIGGNGPIMGHALAMLGLPVTYVGAVGEPGREGGVHPVFDEFAARAKLIPLTPPAHTSALEFGDGKVMLGNLRPLMDLSWKRLLKVVGREQLIALVGGSWLIGLLNWTMLPHLTEIWQRMAREILPGAAGLPVGGRRRIFVDLADPQKRSAADLADAMGALRELQAHADVTLGLNLAEAQQVAATCGVSLGGPALKSLMETAAALREKIGVETVVIHPRHGAAAATSTGTGSFEGPFTDKPVISTGAGDHFNAGFAVGQLLGVGIGEALCLGTAVSGYYVRQAASPAVGELMGFLRELPFGVPPSGGSGSEYRL